MARTKMTAQWHGCTAHLCDSEMSSGGLFLYAYLAISSICVCLCCQKLFIFIYDYILYMLVHLCA